MSLKGTSPQNMIDVNRARHKTSTIKHAYVHLSCLVIGSACALGTVHRERSCLHFMARPRQWLVSGNLNPNCEPPFDLYTCQTPGLLAPPCMNKGGNYVRCNS